MIKLSDYMIKYFEKIGITTVFTLTGGGIMHLVESVGSSSLEYVCCHHEQACSIAAQAYGMYDEKLNVCLITTGPGGTNALTGAAAAYVDSTPMIFISGQVKREDFASLRGVRQFGAQENDIISMAKPVTKYAETVMEPQDILYHMEKAVYLATHGRKGPVWLDIPLDVQATMIDEEALRGYNEEEEKRLPTMEGQIEEISQLLAMAKRPLILAGHGAISSGAQETLRDFVHDLQVPVMGTWRALEIFDTEDTLFFGSPGLQAPRYSNLIMQGCDLLIVLGSRLDNMITAFNEERFAFRATKVFVDIDENELKKLNVPQSIKVNSDVKLFLEQMRARVRTLPLESVNKWRNDCRHLKERFPLGEERQEKECSLDLYKAVRAISLASEKEDAIVISSTSRCNTAGHIAFARKSGQKSISSMGMGSMGFALPSAIGAYYASGKKRIIVIEGDGSFQLNIQELQTINACHIPAKIFVFNNNGYAAITTMQERNFDGHYVGSNEASGVTMPDLEKIAYAYGISYFKIEGNCEIDEIVGKVMGTEGAVICDLAGDLTFDEIPKCISFVNKDGKRESALLENPYPFLDEQVVENIFEELCRI